MTSFGPRGVLWPVSFVVATWSPCRSPPFVSGLGGGLAFVLMGLLGTSLKVRCSTMRGAIISRFTPAPFTQRHHHHHTCSTTSDSKRMAPGYIETYDFTDKRWYTQEGVPRTTRTNAPGSIVSHASTSSATPSFKTYPKEYHSPEPSKNLQVAYRSLPSLDYEYKAKPKAATKPKSIDGHAAAMQRMRPAARFTSANARGLSNNSSIPSTRAAPGGTRTQGRENMAPFSMSAERPAPDYEYEARHHLVHPAPVYEAAKSKKALAKRPSRPTASTLGAHELSEQRSGASWYRPPPSTSTATSWEQNDLPPKESASWYCPRPEQVTTKSPVLRRSKAKVNRASVVRTSLVVATQMQRPEGSVKTWYAGVRRKLFRKGPKA